MNSETTTGYITRTSDSLYISLTFPANTVTDAELWNLADNILRLATSST